MTMELGVHAVQVSGWVLLSGLPCLAELYRAVEDLGKGVSQDWWQFCDFVAAWWLGSSGVWWRPVVQQAVEFCLDVQDGIVIVMRAGQENPCLLGRLERHDHP